MIRCLATLGMLVGAGLGVAYLLRQLDAAATRTIARAERQTGLQRDDLDGPWS